MARKIIMFEGLDNTFKSTNVEILYNELVQQNEICHKLHYSSVKLPKEECIDYSKKMYNSMFQMFVLSKHSFICDRSHLGEFVYGKIYRDYDAQWIFDLEKNWKMHYNPDYYLIVLVDTIENVLARDDGKSHSIDPIKKQFEIDRFTEAYAKSTIKNKLYYAVTGKTPDQIKKDLIDFVFGDQNEI